MAVIIPLVSAKTGRFRTVYSEKIHPWIFVTTSGSRWRKTRFCWL